MGSPGVGKYYQISNAEKNAYFYHWKGPNCLSGTIFRLPGVLFTSPSNIEILYIVSLKVLFYVYGRAKKYLYFSKYCQTKYLINQKNSSLKIHFCFLNFYTSRFPSLTKKTNIVFFVDFEFEVQIRRDSFKIKVYSKPWLRNQVGWENIFLKLICLFSN